MRFQILLLSAFASLASLVLVVVGSPVVGHELAQRQAGPFEYPCPYVGE